eukprot:Protomagalhaensia_wolfi_Nauph_80__22@NODE_1014_length_1809_cov_10_885311_g767_i0_p1_GENE_NODE_1014_length_1809_cov_10_885311_g767_i0NODE_1014_length_1809_cov_10_885311_g767_i0_p1_ORF_typecomplete_len102_score6_75_NODE_1014_length_1809_cov_10_885311_g767_i0234539
MLLEDEKNTSYTTRIFKFTGVLDGSWRDEVCDALMTSHAAHPFRGGTTTRHPPEELVGERLACIPNDEHWLQEGFTARRDTPTPRSSTSNQDGRLEVPQDL